MLLALPPVSTYAIPAEPRRWRREPLAYPVLLALGALDAAGYSVMAPVVPSISESTGAGPAVIGLLVASFSFAMLFGFAAAGLGVRRGHSSAVLLGSLTLVAVGTIAFALSNDLAVLFLARSVMGFGSGGIWIAITFNTLERWPGQEYLCMSRIFAAYAAGGLLGPALGAIGGTRAPFLAYLGLIVAAIPLAMLLGKPPTRRAFGSSRTALRLPGFALASAAILFTWIGFGALEGVLPLHFDDQLGQSSIAALFIMISLAVTASAAAAGRIKPLLVVYAAVPLVVIGIALAGLTDAVPLWILALVLAGIGMGACNTGSTGVLLESVGVDQIVLPMIVWSQLGIVGYLIGPAAGGIVADELGYGAIGLIPLVAGLAVLGALVWTRRRRTTPRSGE